MAQAFECPVCGEIVPANALSCPECGADERAGWNTDEAYLDGVDLPDSETDRSDFARSQARKRVIVAAVAFILIIVFALTFVV